MSTTMLKRTTFALGIALAAATGCDGTPPSLLVDEPAPGDGARGGTGGTGVSGAGAGGTGAGSFGASGGTAGSVPGVVSGAVVSSERAVPMSGGTLLITRADLAIAADPDRDRIDMLDLTSQAGHTIELERGDEPGRVAEGSPGTAYVALRGSGVLAVLDTAAASVTARVPVCVAPRGVAFEAATHSVHVACRSGRLVTLDAGTLAVTRTLELGLDLRDVVVTPSGLFLTRFASAAFTVLTADGTVKGWDGPDIQSACASPTVAYRAVADDNGFVALAHQLSSNQEVGVDEGAYGSSCIGGGLVVGAATLTNPAAAAVVDPNLATPDPLDAPRHLFALSTQTMTQLTPPFDVALDRAGTRLAFIGASSSNPSTLLRVAEIQSGFMTVPSTTMQPLNGQPAAVAFDAEGHWVVQLREPAALVLENGSRFALASDSVADTGQALFHADVGLGMACASCHPEGDEDGHTWHFAAGLRRTQPLPGGVLAREPFHWTGELAGMSDLVSEVMVKRMGLQVVPDAAHVDALGAFLDRIPERPVLDAIDQDAAVRGKTLFLSETVGCASCHVGRQLTDNLSHDVGTGGPFVTPTLIGVGFRTPLFHDGCATTLGGRFGVCGGGDRHGKTSALSAEQAADLVEYLKTL